MKNHTSYLTIEKPGQGQFKERGSRFLAFAYPVTSAEECQKKVDLLCKKYHDARHWCYAYVLGTDKSDFRSNDDGEPSHSAGDPILGQIKARNLTNVLVVVVRYFGGVKLGVGGLANAYKTASQDALDSVQIIQLHLTNQLELIFPYEYTGVINKLINEYQLKVKEQSFEETCTFNLDVRIILKEKLNGQLDQLVKQGIRLSYKWI